MLTRVKLNLVHAQYTKRFDREIAATKAEVAKTTEALAAERGKNAQLEQEYAKKNAELEQQKASTKAATEEAQRKIQAVRAKSDLQREEFLGARDPLTHSSRTPHHITRIAESQTLTHIHVLCFQLSNFNAYSTTTKC